MDFDPTALSFAELLDVFWKGHNPHGARRSSQYKAALFVHNDEQRTAAEETAARIEEAAKARVTTEILPHDGFHLAEGYHQKYRLRRHPEFESPLLATYPDLTDFVNSTAAARLNGYLAGHGSDEAFATDLPLLGLSADARERLSAMRLDR